MWKELDNKLYQLFHFKDFEEAFSFMKKVAILAEEANHHPTWKNSYNRLEIWLSTHDAGDIITEKDHALAQQIDIVSMNFRP